ncbi:MULTISPECIES: MMPL family transporter [unclassified Streptomyces]|uniref:MMPL family transporter n=1 Tax=unclassified Streptomyces TaxID=2593676 RepID=UPI0035D7E6C7
MTALARCVVRHRWWTVVAWIVLALAGAFAAPRATDALSYDFGLPGRPGYEANQEIARRFDSGGENAPVLMTVTAERGTLGTAQAREVAAAVERTRPGGRLVTWEQAPDLLARDGRTGVVLVYPRPLPGAPEPYAHVLPALEGAAQRAARASGTEVTVTGQAALAEGGGGDSGVLGETLFGGVGALIVLVLVFGSVLAVTPLVVAAVSILTTFLIMWWLTALTEVSFIVQYLLALIGLGVAIDYALLIVTRWREERGHGAGAEEAIVRSMATAGRAVLFSGLTVAISLAALIALPVPFLRSVGFTGLLIPLVSVVTALTLLPALLMVAGGRLDWPHRRRTEPDSKLWRRIATTVVRHRWISATVSLVVLLALAAPVLGLRLGAPSNDSVISAGGPAAAALQRVQDAGLGKGLTQPVEVLTADPDVTLAAVADLPGVAGTASPEQWRRGDRTVVDVWTAEDPATSGGSAAAERIRTAAEEAGQRVGGLPAQDADFVDAVYGNAWWIGGIIVLVTFVLLVRALRSVVLPLKALVLNVISLAAAYGVTVLIWQEGHGTELLFGQSASDAITTWVPIAVFSFLFGLSMDYEVFLLSRIREEYLWTGSTDRATIDGVARTGRLITCAAVILFLAFISLSRVPVTDVKILATALALGIVIDATIVRGVLAPALVAALGRANWWLPGRWSAGRVKTGGRAR